MGDIGDVWNAVKDVATLFGNGQSQAMGTRAFACPQGVQPGQLDWTNDQGGTLSLGVNMTNNARELFGMSSGCSLRLGVIWQFGGTSSEHPGFYLHDAYLWAVLDYSSAGTSFTVTGSFGDAVPVGNSAELGPDQHGDDLPGDALGATAVRHSRLRQRRARMRQI